MNRGSHHSRSGESGSNARSVGAIGNPSYRRGMQPKPSNPRDLYRECNRLTWALHVLAGKRATLGVLCDRYDQKRAALRRELDAASIALEAVAPEKFAQVEQRRRDLDDPKKALEWAQRTHEGSDGA